MKEEYENFTLIFLDSLINKLLRKLSEIYMTLIHYYGQRDLRLFVSEIMPETVSCMI